jgi:mono/diheme cytochrome c family protein
MRFHPRTAALPTLIGVLASAWIVAVWPTPARAETPLERGSYLVNSVMACDGCHTPRGPNGFVMEKRFSGGSQTWDTPAYTVKGSNITSDRDTGIGVWSADDLKRALTQGVRPSGIPLAPQMPFVFYKILTPHDLDAVVTYIRSASAVRNEVQTPSYKADMKFTLIPGADKPMSDEDLRDSVKRGFYLATIAHCMECHARRPDGVQDFQTWWGKGGFEFRDTWGAAVARNITSDRTAGIGAYSDAEIKRVLVEGIGRDGRALKPPMARHIYFKHMTEDDVGALIAWLRTLPPLE